MIPSIRCDLWVLTWRVHPLLVGKRTTSSSVLKAVPVRVLKGIFRTAFTTALNTVEWNHPQINKVSGLCVCALDPDRREAVRYAHPEWGHIFLK